ncbi:hypothetical protein [Saccharicrinis sp. 156]|uniref:hypothetical protein n=1 Tax=Saccharicrinis sp. 156 TaxID=3417574 RepID=UPI003D33AD97
MNQIETIIRFVYSYCTDFVINLANIFNLSYYEINFLLFCVLYPLLLIVAVGMYIVQRSRLKKLKEINSRIN